MTNKEMLIKQKLSLLQLAEKLKNIRQVCNSFGVSRTLYYNIRKRYYEEGLKNLEEKERRSPNMPNQTESNIEKQIITYSLENPGFGKDRVVFETEDLQQQVK